MTSSDDELRVIAKPPTGPSPDSRNSHQQNQENAQKTTTETTGCLPTNLSTFSTLDLANFPTQDTVKLVAAYLGEIIKSSEAMHLLGGAKGDLTRFHARTVPAIDILAYLQRILRYAPCGNEVLLAVVVYFERLLRRAVLLLEAQKLGLATPKLQASAIDSLEKAAARIPPDLPLTRRGSVTQSPSVSRSASGIIAPISPSKPADQISPHVPSLSNDQLGMHVPSPPSLLTMPTPTVTDPGLIEMAMAAIESTEFTMSKKRKKSILILSSYNIHRMLITGVMVASKLFSDVFFLNSHYAKVCFTCGG
jgi:hypothetical protein